eukprot:COSAG04_NODE_1371_length_7040_cov_8.745714_5_plen_106_part_00
MAGARLPAQVAASSPQVAQPQTAPVVAGSAAEAVAAALATPAGSPAGSLTFVCRRPKKSGTRRVAISTSVAEPSARATLVADLDKIISVQVVPSPDLGLTCLYSA